MSKPTIIFYNLKSLFEVFDELKERLKFEILFFYLLTSLMFDELSLHFAC